MIEIIDSPDVKQWSEFVYRHPYGNIYQTPEMAEVYKRTKNYEPISLAVIDENDNIIALLLAVVIKEMRGILGTFSARSIIEGGPLFVEGEKGIKAVSLLIHKYEEITRRKSIYSEIRMINKMSQMESILVQQGYFFEDHYNAIIDLNKSKEELWKQLKRDRKRGIKKAKELNVVVEECTKKEEIPICYNLILRTYRNARIPLADISLFEAAFDILVPRHEAVFLFAKHDDKCIATQIALIYKDTIYAWYTGAIREYLSHHPGDLLIWYLLEWGAENGYKVFDFGGGGTPTKNQNIRYYKSRFGAVFPNYGRYKKVYSPIKMKIAEKGFEIYRKIKYSSGK